MLFRSARQTFVAGADRGGRRLVVTLVKADVEPIRPWEQAARLLDYGFALPESTSVGALVEPGSVSSDEAEDTGSVTVAAPPAGASPVSAAGAATHSSGGASTTTIVAVGGGIIAVLVASAAVVQGRRRR